MLQERCGCSCLRAMEQAEFLPLSTCPCSQLLCMPQHLPLHRKLPVSGLAHVPHCVHASLGPNTMLDVIRLLYISGEGSTTAYPHGNNSKVTKRKLEILVASHVTLEYPF